MKVNMEKLMTYIFVASITGGFSANTIDNSVISDAFMKLLQVYPDLEEFKISRNNNTSWASNNRSINIFICNNCNYTKIENSAYNPPFDVNSPEIMKKDMKDLSSLTLSLSQLTASGLHQRCKYDQDCRKVSYSECSAERCSCKPNYYARDGKCFGLIKEACEVDSDCGVVGSFCQSKVCECKNGYYGSNTECIQFSRGPGDSCRTSRECLRVNYLSCVENVCKCETNYQQQGNSCLGLMNATCSSDDDCAVKNSSCHLNTCQCPNGFYSNDTCYKYAESLIEVCESDEACKYLPYSSCLNGHCLCLPNYVGSSGTCHGMINAPCNNSTECIANNAVCNGTCQCPDNHYFENNQCLKYAERLFVPVVSAQACQSLANSIFTNKQCVCSIGFYYEDHQCHKIPVEYDSPVSTARGCEYLEDSYFFEGKCYPFARHVYDPCRYDHQCKVPFSSCSNGTCQCKQGYVEHKNVCYGLDSARCNVPTDCALTAYTCTSGTCSFIEYIGAGSDWKSHTEKPGATVIYGGYHSSSPSGVDHLIGTRESNFRWATGNLAWKNNNYTLDKVYYHKSANSTTLIVDCRVEADDGTFMFGFLLMPGNGRCTGQYNSQNFSSENYSLLVDLGY